MPSFFEVKTGDVSVIGLFISFAVLVVGGVSTVYFEVFYEPPHYTVLMCDSNSGGCGHVVEVDQDGFREMTKQMTDLHSGGEEGDAEAGPDAGGMPPGGPVGMPGPGFGPMMMGPPWGQPGWGIVCPKCGEPQLYRAIKCDECDKVFYRNPGVRFGDECECGYSRSKAMREKADAEK